MDWPESAMMQVSAAFILLIWIELAYFTSHTHVYILKTRFIPLTAENIITNDYVEKYMFCQKESKFKGIFLSNKTLGSSDNPSWWATFGSEKSRPTPGRAGFSTITQSIAEWR